MSVFLDTRHRGHDAAAFILQLRFAYIST